MNVRNLVSVIMPMHNSERFLATAIESVMAQTYSHWELLIIDDFSTDNSVAIAKEYARRESRIRLLKNKTRKGMPSAPRNVGAQAAKGRFIAFLDSDDLWFPQKLEQQIALFSDNRTAIVYSNYEKIDEHGVRSNRIVIAPPIATYRTLLHGNVIGNLTGIYDTFKVGKIGIQDIHHEDYAMWLYILKQGYIAQNTGTTLAAYRISSQSISSNKMKVISWQWNIYRKVEHLSLFQSAYYFLSYAWKAFFKSII
ncbi:MAG: glycosyltransferase family 2 protein [Bacteroidaceae bacterium]|nr:glycosyltransferase family 2 protein [Bacteroidaceae bacterium]